MTSEQVATDPVTEAPDTAANAGRRRGPLARPHRRSRRRGHRGFRPVPAVPQGWHARRPVLLPGLLHRGHAGVPGSAHRRRPPAGVRTRRVGADHVPSEHLLDAADDVDRHGRRARRCDPHDTGRDADPRSRPEHLRDRVRDAERFRDRAGRTDGPSVRADLRRVLPAGPVFDNWIGLIPPVGQVDFLRAPSSDVNITIGMALVRFTTFDVEGVRHLGVRGYLGKFFPVYEFRPGSAPGSSRCSSASSS